jgi:hypothetical protein
MWLIPAHTKSISPLGTPAYGNKVQRRLHAGHRTTNSTPCAQRPADHGHGVHIVEQKRLGHSSRMSRAMSTATGMLRSARNKPRPQGIADALVHAVLERIW